MPIARVARVLPDLTGLDKEFDYLIPEDMAPSVQVGSLLRVPLHGRRVGGWVIELDPSRRAGHRAAADRQGQLAWS